MQAQSRAFLYSYVMFREQGHVGRHRECFGLSTQTRSLKPVRANTLGLIETHVAKHRLLTLRLEMEFGRIFRLDMAGGASCARILDPSSHESLIPLDIWLGLFEAE